MNPALEIAEPFLAQWTELLLALAAVVGIGVTLWLFITQRRSNREAERRRQAWDAEAQSWRRWRAHIDRSMDDFDETVHRYGGRVRAIEAKLGLRPPPAPTPATPAADCLAELEARLRMQLPEKKS